MVHDQGFILLLCKRYFDVTAFVERFVNESRDGEGGGGAGLGARCGLAAVRQIVISAPSIAAMSSLSRCVR